MSSPVPIPTPLHEEPELLDPNPICINCGYDLSGLDNTQPCPECGTPLAQSSQQGNLLRHAPLPWVLRISRGLHLFHASLLWPVLGMLTVLVLSVIVGLIAGVSGEPIVKSIFDGLQVVLMVGYMVLLPLCAVGYIVACWFISEAPPGGLAPPPAHRNIVRWIGPVIPALILLADRLIPAITPPLHTLPRLIATALIWSFLFSLRRIFEHLERRTSSWDPKFIRKHHNDRTNLVVMLILCTIGPVWSVIAWFVNGTAAPWSVMGLGLALAVLYLISSTPHRVQEAVWLERTVARARRQLPPLPTTDKVSP